MLTTCWSFTLLISFRKLRSMALLIPVSIRAPHMPPRIAVLWYGLSLVNQKRALEEERRETPLS